MIITCPHCNMYILIEQINCAIFRHGVYRDTGQQLNPHASKIECDNAITHDLIYGCGMPFKLIQINDEYTAVICDYI